MTLITLPSRALAAFLLVCLLLTHVGAQTVSFPSPEVEFIAGPQVKSADATNPAP